MGQAYCLATFRSRSSCLHQISSKSVIKQTVFFPNEEFMFLFSWLPSYHKVKISTANQSNYFSFLYGNTVQGLVFLKLSTKIGKMCLLREMWIISQASIFFKTHFKKIQNASSYGREERDEELLQKDLGEVLFDFFFQKVSSFYLLSFHYSFFVKKKPTTNQNNLLCNRPLLSHALMTLVGISEATWIPWKMSPHVAVDRWQNCPT